LISDLASSIARNPGPAVLATQAVLLATLLVLLWGLARQARLTRLYYRLTRGTSGGNLEEILVRHLETVQQLAKHVESLERRVEAMAEKQKHCVQHVGLVRYDAFDDVGGQQSFSLALLDGMGNGVALSSVYSRADVRVYGKSIRAGRPSHPLTQEEERALKASAEA